MSEDNKVINQNIKKLVSFIANRQQVHYPEIMSFLKVSRKEVARYLDIISKMLKNSGSELVRKRNVGIFFKGNVDLIYQIFQTNNDLTLSTNNRQNLILLSLLLNNKDGIKLENLSNKYYVSRSTLDRDIKELKTNLNSTLRIVGTKNGLKIEGDEEEKRNQASQIIYKYWMETFENNARKISVPNELKDLVGNNTIKGVQEMLFELTNKTNIIFTEYQYQSIFIHICIMIDRIRNKRFLKYNIKNKEIILQETEELCKLVNKKFSIEVPLSEKLYLNVHIIGAKKNIKGQISKEYYCKESILCNYLKENFAEWDEQLIKDLTIHLNGAIYRAKNFLHIFNPYKSQIFNLYPVAVNEAIDLSSKLAKKYNVEFNNDEIAYIAIHIEAYKERARDKRQENKKIRIVVVCSSGIGTARMIVQRVKNSIKADAVVTRVVSAEELLAQSIPEDIIVSTIPIQDATLHVIVVNPIITEEDIRKIRSAVNAIQDKRSKQIFLDLLTPKTIFIGNLNSSKEIIHYIGKKLIEFGFGSPKIIDSIYKREKIASTALSQLKIAIPHPEPNTVLKTNISIYIPKEEISWGQSKVNLIFFMSYNKSDINVLPFDEIYHGFNLMVSSSALRLKLLAAKTSIDAYKIIYNFLN